MGLTILDVGSKYGSRNTIKFFSLIVQFHFWHYRRKSKNE